MNRSPLQLAVFRAAFFGLLAADLLTEWLAMAGSHAGRTVHVAAIGALDWLPAPGSFGMAAVIGVSAIASATLAVGIRPRVTSAALALGLWTWLGWSFADGYQHHLLIAMVATAWAGLESARTEERAGWVLAMAWQLAIVYAFAALAKLDGVWTRGDWFAAHVLPDLPFPELVAELGPVVPWTVVAIELLLAAALLMRRHLGSAAVLAIFFHGALLFSSLRIGRFAGFMLIVWIGLLIEWPKLRLPTLSVPQRAVAAGGVLVAALGPWGGAMAFDAARAQALAAAGELDAARSAARRAERSARVALFEGGAAAADLGAAFGTLGEDTRALKWLERAVERGAPAPAFENMVRALVRLGRTREAHAHLRSQARDRPDLQMLMASMAIDRGDPRAARWHLQQVIRLRPQRDRLL